MSWFWPHFSSWPWWVMVKVTVKKIFLLSDATQVHTQWAQHCLPCPLGPTSCFWYHFPPWPWQVSFKTMGYFFSFVVRHLNTCSCELNIASLGHQYIFGSLHSTAVTFRWTRGQIGEQPGHFSLVSNVWSDYLAPDVTTDLISWGVVPWPCFSS